MKKIIVTFVGISVLISSCQGPSKDDLGASMKLNFIDSIESRNLLLLDSLKLVRFNDSARWRLYTLHCDDTIRQGDRYFAVGSLPLKLTYVHLQRDTLDLLYKFALNDTTPLEHYSDEIHISDGVRFNTATSEVLGLIRGDAVVMEKGQFSRYENPLQTDVVQYIKANQDSLNFWFKQEAMRRRVFQ